MLYEKFLEFEKFLDFTKDKENRVKSLETSILCLKTHVEARGMNFKEELSYIKIHYQSQLSLSDAPGTIFSLFAIVVAVVLGIFDVDLQLDCDANSLMVKLFNVLPLLPILAILIAVFRFHVITRRHYKKAVTYSIIINVIDKVLDDV